MCWGPAHADPLFFCVVSDIDIDVLSIELDIEIRLIIFVSQ